MPITATCTSCAKSYQAPDAMAGKSVRCKSCGTIFKIESPDLGAAAPGDLDFEALERSFSGESVDAPHDGPMVDAKGKVSIRRSADVSDIKLSGETGSGVRSNFRYRFPFAKQVDQFLPWVLLIGSLGLLIKWSLSLEATGVPESPSAGVGLSRFFLLLGCYLILVWPASHIALTKAAKKLRFSMPKAALWRSFTGFLPVLLLGAGFYMISGGDPFGLIVGLLLGVLLSVGAITLLYRLFPNEMPIVGAYTSVGAIIGGMFSIATLVAINLVSLSVANMSKKEPTLFVSPIALGLKWQDRPAPVVASNKNVTKPPVETPATQTAPPTTEPAVQTALVLPTVSVPEPAAGPKMIRSIEVTPVTPGFDRIVVPPADSDIIGVIRRGNGGMFECYSRSTWFAVGGGRGFEAGQSDIVPNTRGNIAVRIVTVPSYRIEQVRIGRGPEVKPIEFSDSFIHTLFGFLDERFVLVLGNRGGYDYTLECYDIQSGRIVGSPTQFSVNGGNLDLVDVNACVRLSPDGRYLLAAGRASNDSSLSGVIALYNSDDVSRPVTTRTMRLSDRLTFRPNGLAIDNAGQVAMLLDTGNEAFLAVWQMRNRRLDGVEMVAPTNPVVDRKIGILSDLVPPGWDNEYDALLWLNDNTLLLYGTHLVDASTGRIIGSTGVKEVVGQVRGGSNVALLVTRANMMIRSLTRVTFDPAAIEQGRESGR